MPNPGGGTSSRRSRRTLFTSARAGALVATFSVASFVAAATAPSTADAGTDGSSPHLTASISSLQAQILTTATQLHDLAGTDDRARAHLDAAEVALASDRSTLSAVRGDLAKARTQLRNVALNAYVRASDGSELSVFSVSPADDGVSQMYLKVAAGTESGAIDRFALEQVKVARDEARVGAERDDAAAAYATSTRQYGELLAEATNEQSMLAQVQQQQAVLAVQAAQAARSAQAASQGPPSKVDLSVLTAPPSGSLAQKLARLRQCESGGNYQDDTGNGYYGAYQFSAATWQGLGYSGLPNQAAPAVQDAAATRLVQSDGWSQWPACSAMLGLD